MNEKQNLLFRLFQSGAMKNMLLFSTPTVITLLAGHFAPGQLEIYSNLPLNRSEVFSTERVLVSARQNSPYPQHKFRQALASAFSAEHASEVILNYNKSLGQGYLSQVIRYLNFRSISVRKMLTPFFKYLLFICNFLHTVYLWIIIHESKQTKTSSSNCFINIHRSFSNEFRFIELC